jgi:hypothetical protein
MTPFLALLGGNEQSFDVVSYIFSPFGRKFQGMGSIARMRLEGEVRRGPQA